MTATERVIRTPQEGLSKDIIGAKEKIFPISSMQQAIDNGYEGFVYQDSRTRERLVYKAKLPDNYLLDSYKKPLTVITSSDVRQNFLKYLLEVSRSPLSLAFYAWDQEEILANTPDIVALLKAKSSNSDFSLSIDSLTMIPGKGYVKKPLELNEIENNLQQIYHYAQSLRLDKAYYYLNTASVLCIGNNEYVGKNAIVIGLNLNKLAYLTTRRGVSDYMEIADRFQDKSINQNYAESLKNVGGGIALPILLHLKVVESINGISLDNSQDEVFHALLSAYRTILVGGGDSVYQGLFGKKVKKDLNNWPWLRERANSLLKI